MDAAAPPAHPWDAQAQHQHVNATRKACPAEYSCWRAALKSDHWSLLHCQYSVETASKTTELLQEMC